MHIGKLFKELPKKYYLHKFKHLSLDSRKCKKDDIIEENIQEYRDNEDYDNERIIKFRSGLFLCKNGFQYFPTQLYQFQFFS